MANTTIEPNMSLILPTPGVEFGPQYAADQNQDLLIIGAHTHAPGSGVQITPAGLNISTNLTFQNNNPTNVGAVVFSSPQTRSSLTTLYTAPQSGGGINDLFYNDGAGNIVALTKAGLVNATISSLPGESYAGGTFTWKQGAGSTTPANFDIGAITIRPNVAATSNGVVVSPPAAISSLYNLQLPTVPAFTSFLQIDSSGNITPGIAVTGGITTTNIASATILGSNIAAATIAGSNIVAQTLTQGLLAPKTTGTTVAAGGVAISGSSGSFTTSSTGGTYVSVTNLTVTITTTGRPVYVSLQSASGTTGFVGVLNASGLASQTAILVALINNTTSTQYAWSAIQANVTTSTLPSQLGVFVPPAGINALDTGVNGTPGTYTYQAFVTTASNAGTNSGQVSNCVLVAYEI